MKVFGSLIAFMLLVAAPLRAEIDIAEVTSPGGVTAWLVQEESIPFVALELRFKGGASLDLPGKRGATNLMVGLLEEGAGDLDSRAFSERAESLAASFDFDIGDDAVSISARFLVENQDEALALLRDAITQPRFDQDAIDRVKAQIVSVVRSDAQDPDNLVGVAFDTMVFGDHPYGSAIEGTEDSIAALTRDDLIEAHKGALARDRVYVGAAGDISAEELAVVLDKLLVDLPETGTLQAAAVDVSTEAGVTVVPFDVPQSVAIFGHEGIARDDPDFFPAFVLNEILGGGGFEARLMEEVREKRGLTYGVYSYLVPKDHASLYLGRVSSANDRIAEAIKVIRDEWSKMAETGVTEEELEVAKTYLTGAYPLRFDGNGPIANILVGMQMDDLPVDYVNTRNAKIEAITLDDIKRVAARVLKPEALHFVVVGQPEGLDS
ncbi:MULTISPECIES: M16 family metallopeptidase [Marivita]|uniref:Insulinase family protein n=1 Tax=Marivita cryptomonadis TaxID=505252 RepID=A0A9Q2NV45_9RHOB|nr:MULTISPECIES: pitrilysin family protein [Marivita]MCR9168946.1 insulinase family protein [Paracoccaceae bacterium]MBM2321623.1 insulinase family protein [Marivita cryptomonadis]MBM2331204.1 insulinase family protein [Marivita cryptomonadis]MBM2340790.1 insulinase family protein [Marivita cryptomonadis]MBM2345452.1 insulinase family protein [Marivita cryptomonadis]